MASSMSPISTRPSRSPAASLRQAAKWRCGRLSRASSAAKPHAALERVFREEAGRLTESLVRLLDNFDLAEELVFGGDG